MGFSPVDIRRQFPALRDLPEGHAYVDSAATTLRPQPVLDLMNEFQRALTGNVHRGLHRATDVSTNRFEAARESVRSFIGAAHVDEVILTSGTTASINILAQSLVQSWKKGDVVALSLLEHHSNIVPWQMLKRFGIDVRWIDIDEQGSIDFASLDAVLQDRRVKLVSISGQSNVLGVRPPLPAIIDKAHAANALVCVDASQLVGHAPIDVQALDCDFLAFSGHKIYGPTGSGALYGKRALLKNMPPAWGGGGMVREVTTAGFVPDDVPARFEAGSPPIAATVGLGAAIEWQKTFDWKDREAHERSLIDHLYERLSAVSGVRILGPKDASKIFGCMSFVMDGAHPHDIADILAERGISVRSGNHCAQPLHTRLKIPASTRVSVALYTTIADIDAFIEGLLEVKKILKV